MDSSAAKDLKVEPPVTAAEPIRIRKDDSLAKTGNLSHKCHMYGAHARFVNVWSN